MTELEDSISQTFIPLWVFFFLFNIQYFFSHRELLLNAQLKLVGFSLITVLSSEFKFNDVLKH